MKRLNALFFLNSSFFFVLVANSSLVAGCASQNSNPPVDSVASASAVNAQKAGGAEKAESVQTAPAKPITSPLHLTILATTDIHANVRAYDYYKDAPVDHYGLSKAATLVKEERKKQLTAMLVDTGDLIQGSPLGDVVARVSPLKKGDIHAVYKAMNLMGYTAANLGNHEFNYGLPFLQKTLLGARFPYVATSLFVKEKSGPGQAQKPLVTLVDMFKIVDTQVGGKKLRVGFLGFAPPQIMDWDKDNLNGTLEARDILESAKAGLAALKKQGADVVVAIAHSGINPLPYDKNMENASFHLASLEGIDAVVAGHSHMEFPGKKFEGQEKLGIDALNGTVKGKPVVMPGFWGSHLGVLTVNLEHGPAGWKAIGGHALLRSAKGVAEDAAVIAAVDTQHRATLKYVRSPVGTFTAPVQTYFSRVVDSAAVQLVNDAQTWFARKELKGTAYAKYPLLSASAPFKAGFGGEYTQIDAGKVAIKNVADLYVYPNTVKAVLLKGSQVKDWLEKSAQNFAQVDPTREGEINVVNDKFPSYNFDVFSGVNYMIDVSKAPGSRIVGLAFQGKPVAPADVFVVVTNNYRATGGGGFPHLDGKNIILDSATENRQVLLDYIQSSGVLKAKAANNWKLAPMPGSKARLVVETSLKAKPFAGAGLKLLSENAQSQTAKFEILAAQP